MSLLHSILVAPGVVARECVFRKEKDMNAIPNTLQNEKGQGLMEYALILVLIAIVVVVALTALGTSISNALLGPVIAAFP